MKKNSSNTRPILITVLCIIGFIGTPLQFFGIILQKISPWGELLYGKIIPTWYIFIDILFIVMFFIGLIYIWKMKKVGVLLYGVTTILELVTGYFAGVASLIGLIGSTILMVLFFTKYRLMN